MKYIFSFLLVIHGLIHVMGFVKAFQLAEVKSLTHSISRTAGLFWLLAAACLITITAMYILNSKYWYYPAFLSIILSQILIVGQWQDAKWGTLANMMILVVALTAYFTSTYYESYSRDVHSAMQQKAYFNSEMMTESDISHLPEPVKRYLRYTGCIGKPKVNDFKILFTGKIRKDEKSAWMPFSSEQYNFMHIPTRLFFMKASMFHLPVAGYHRYADGDAMMDIRLASMFRVQFQEGEQMDQAETVTFFNDMCCMAPATLIDPRISWQPIDDQTVHAIFTHKGISISADLYFNALGQLINFKSNDRYNTEAGKKLPWSTPLKNYQERNGYRLATYAETIYTYPDHDLCYGTFEFEDIQYNVHKAE